jgi:hypothetical protein
MPAEALVFLRAHNWRPRRKWIVLTNFRILGVND